MCISCNRAALDADLSQAPEAETGRGGGRDGPPPVRRYWWCFSLCSADFPGVLCLLKYETHWPWFLNEGLLNSFQPPFLHWLAFVGGPMTGTWVAPLTLMFVMSAAPWTSIRIEIPV